MSAPTNRSEHTRDLATELVEEVLPAIDFVHVTGTSEHVDNFERIYITFRGRPIRITIEEER